MTISLHQIKALREEADVTDDIVTAVLCEHYLSDQGIDPEDYTGGGHSSKEMLEIRKIAKMNDDEVLSEIVKVLGP